MTDKQVDFLREREYELKKKQERIQKEIDDLRRSSPCIIVHNSSDDEEMEFEGTKLNDDASEYDSTDNEQSKKEETENAILTKRSDKLEFEGTKEKGKETENSSEDECSKKPCTKRNVFITQKKTPMKRPFQSGLLTLPQKRKKKVVDVIEKDIHFMINDEPSSSKASESSTIESINKTLIMLTKRIEKIEKHFIVKKDENETPITLSDMKSKNIKSKSAFIALRDVWIPDLSEKIGEILTKLDDLNETRK